MNLDAVKAKKVKGDVKAQGERYIARVVAEKRFQCGLCQRVFKTNAQHRKHTANLSCQKKPLVYVCVPCDYSTKIKTHLIRHHQTAKHKTSLFLSLSLSLSFSLSLSLSFALCPLSLCVCVLNVSISVCMSSLPL